MGKIKKEKNSKNVQEKKSPVETIKKKKNGEKKKNSPEEGTRKYGYISANSVIMMAESAGFSGIQEDVAKNLAEDVTYRLRYIIQQCKKYMIHSKHTKLRSADINEVLKMCDVPALYGYTADEPQQNFIYIKEADVFVLEDNLIDLPSFALTEIMVQPKPSISTTGVWLKPEENKSRGETKVKNEDTKGGNSEFHDNSENIKHGSKSLAVCDNQKAGNENVAENETKIPTNLIKYYGITCNTILGHSDLKIIFQDLSSSSRIVPIIPYLLNFITIALNKLASDRQIKRLLQTVEALSRNQKIDFCPYSATTRVINAMLLIVAIDKKPAKISYDYHLRYYAGRVLSRVLGQWCTRDEQRITIIKKMGKILGDFKASPKVHFGAISLLTALGAEALAVGLWGNLKQFLMYLEELKKNEKFKSGSDSAMLEEVILGAAVSLYRSQKSPREIFPELDDCLSSFFGDSICNIWTNLLSNPKFLGPRQREYYCARDSESIKNSKQLKYMNSRYKPKTKKLTVDSVFVLPKARKKRITRIMFKFAGAIPVPEVSLKRKRMDPQYSQFIAGKESEGHVVVAGRFPRAKKPLWLVSPTLPVGCLFSIL